MAVEGDMTGGERTMASVLGLGLTEEKKKKRKRSSALLIRLYRPQMESQTVNDSLY